MCIFRLRPKHLIVAQVVNHTGLTPSDSLKLIVCICSLPVCVWPLCLWQGALKCHCCKRPSPSHCMFYELSSEDMGALSSDRACCSSVFITADHFPLAFFHFFFFFDEGEETHLESSNIYNTAPSVAIG